MLPLLQGVRGTPGLVGKQGDTGAEGEPGRDGGKGERGEDGPTVSPWQRRIIYSQINMHSIFRHSMWGDSTYTICLYVFAEQRRAICHVDPIGNLFARALSRHNTCKQCSNIYSSH